jgi:hypothetical protein
VVSTQFCTSSSVPVAPVSGLDLTRYSNPLILIYISLTINSIFALDDCCSYWRLHCLFRTSSPLAIAKDILEIADSVLNLSYTDCDVQPPNNYISNLIVAGLCFISQDPFQIVTLDNHNSIFSFHFLWNLHVCCYRSPHKQNLSFQCSWMITTATTACNKLWTMLEPWYIDWYCIQAWWNPGM